MVTGVDWLSARRALLAEQKAYFAEKWPKSAAAKLGFYGLSAGAGPRGEGLVVNGTGSAGKIELIHPHYVLLSGAIDPKPASVYRVLADMEAHGLLPPWGMVENFDKDLNALPADERAERRVRMHRRVSSLGQVDGQARPHLPGGGVLPVLVGSGEGVLSFVKSLVTGRGRGARSTSIIVPK